MFRHRAWMSTAAYWTGLVALAYFALRDMDWVRWVPAMLLTYLVASITISVGYHRLFCHGSFKVSRFWHVLFAITGTLFMYSSPLQWSVTHATHHRFSDTDRDPHPKPRDALIFKGYRDVPLDTWQLRRLVRRSGVFHMWVDQWYVLIYGALVAVLCLVSPAYVLNAYLPALGLAHFVGGLHNLISHAHGHPRDLPWMEYILPASGEWLHGRHHDKAGLWDFRTQWWHVDLGALVIRAIKS